MADTMNPPDFCPFLQKIHDTFTALLTGGLCIGLMASYIPQHYKIIHAKTSQGLNPIFLLLGSTSAASGMLNVITLQWLVFRCCKYLKAGECIESLGAVWIVGLQWLFFTTVLVLYLIYFPPHLKYVNITSLTVPWSHDMITTEHVPSTEWRQATITGITTLVHFLFICFTTFFLILTEDMDEYPSSRIMKWATFLGLLSTTLAVVQYAPQLHTTWNAKLVGALSIPMMAIQSPGAVLMVLSIAVRPGTNWTSWATYAAAGIMQGSLLIMCLCWKVRQRRLDIDDFGRPLHSQHHVEESHSETTISPAHGATPAPAAHSETTPLLNHAGGSGAPNGANTKKTWYSFWKK